MSDRRLSRLVPWLLLVGCADAPQSSLFRVDAEPPGANCAAGGSVIRTGVDQSRDGRLDDAEVRDVSYVCNGAAARTTGASTLVKLVPEPAGAHCAEGGTAVEAGIDLDDDGVLAESEVSSVSYVCGGADGTLVRVAPEPAGPHCVRGGTSVESGPDRDHDGVLEDGEVTSTSWVCAPVPTVLTGDVHVKTPADLAQLTGVPRIDGSLFIEDPALTLLYLPNLVAVAGDVTVEVAAAALTTVRLPTLESVGGRIDVDIHTVAEVQLTALARAGELRLGGAALATVDLSALQTVDGELALSGYSIMTMPSMPRLRRVGAFTMTSSDVAMLALPENLATIDGDLSLSYNRAARGILAPSPLHVHGDVYLGGNDQMTYHDFSGTIVDGRFQVEDNPLLVELYSPAAAHEISLKSSHVQHLILQLDGDSLPSLDVESNAALTSIEALGDLRYIGDIEIRSNSMLTSLKLPRLDYADSLYIMYNARLPQCSLDALKRQLPPPTMGVYITEGNDELATCN